MHEKNPLYLQEKMARYVKYIVFVLLTITFQGVAGKVFTEKAVEQAACDDIGFLAQQQGQFSAPEFPYIPVAELTNLQGHQLSGTRLQRVQLEEYYSVLRNLLQTCAEYNSSLSQQKGRLYNTTISHYCQPPSEYYIFALRRIII